MLPKGCAETATSNYHYSLRNKPRRAQLSSLRSATLDTAVLFNCALRPFTADVTLGNEMCRKAGRRLERNLDPRDRSESGRQWAVRLEGPRKFTARSKYDRLEGPRKLTASSKSDRLEGPRKLTASSKSDRLKRFQYFLTHETGDYRLTFASPWIITQFKQINQPDATVPQVYYFTFMCGSTCFGGLHAHHQELTIALAASGFTVGAWW